MTDAAETARRMRELQDSEEVHDLFSKVVSGGRPGYKTIIEKDKPTIKCGKCDKILSGDEKFCPECGSPAKNESN